MDAQKTHIPNNHKTDIQLFFLTLIHAAQQKNASDIHITPHSPDEALITIRTHTFLQKHMHIDAATLQKLTVHIKVLAQLDITINQAAQDGAFYLKSKALYCRVNFCPTLYGARMAIRLLPLNHVRHLNNIGITTFQHTVLMRNLSQNQGLILICGPTGSGKTTTIYAMLNAIKSQRSIVCACDPIEILMYGISQTPICPPQFTYSDAIRTFMRQDPDVIMLGEIRDVATCKAVIHAANTGHLVISSLHSNNTKTAVRQLLQLGCTLDTIASTVQLIVAQRLIPTICPCKQEKTRCNQCHNGYKGVCAIYELLEQTPYNRQLIRRNHIDMLSPYPSLWESGYTRVTDNQITINDLRRVIRH